MQLFTLGSTFIHTETLYSVHRRTIMLIYIIGVIPLTAIKDLLTFKYTIDPGQLEICGMSKTAKLKLSDKNKLFVPAPSPKNS